MKLGINEIELITLGTVSVKNDNNAIVFHRFTEEQEKIYEEWNRDKHLATAGVKLKFRTNSRNLFLKAEVSQGSSRSYFAFDIVVDGKLIDSLANFSENEMTGDYTKLEFKLGEYSKSFDIGVGEKIVEIYFPWSVAARLLELSIDDCAFVEPVKCNKKLLVFGDSITQGYDALHPINRYPARLANELHAEEINKAIGGEVFNAEYVRRKESFIPDFITVAYGTNDWNRGNVEKFNICCEEFYQELAKNYSASKIFAITPIWRADIDKENNFSDFDVIEKKIREVTSKYDNIVCISGRSFVDEDNKYFADLRLHPNEEGFSCYFDNLFAEIKKYI